MKLFVSSSPHIRHRDTTTGIMLDVILALVPVGIASIVMYGFKAVMLIAVCIASAVASEYLWCKAIKKQPTLFQKNREQKCKIFVPEEKVIFNKKDAELKRLIFQYSFSEHKL